MTPREIRSTSIQDIEAMWHSITTIEAQDLLLKLKIADWAHMKKADRASLHKEWHKKAYPRDWEEKKSLSWNDLGQILKR